MEKISVLMSVYNEPLDYLKQSVQSILNQSYQNFEYIIILDNPLREDFIAFLEELSDDRIKFFVNEQNIGLSKSLNFAIKQASGSFFARMDADDLATQDRLEKQLAYLVDNKLDLCSSLLITIDMQGKVINRTSEVHYSSEQINQLLNFRSPMAHPTWFGRRQVFLDLGGYRDFHACEDYDFLLRGKEKNIKLGVVPEFLLYYRLNESSISNSNLYKQYLSTKFLKENRKKISNLSKKDLEDYLLKHFSEKQSHNFSKAKYYFNQAKRMTGLKKIASIIKSIVISPEMIQLYFNTVRTKLILKRSK